MEGGGTYSFDGAEAWSLRTAQDELPALAVAGAATQALITVLAAGRGQAGRGAGAPAVLAPFSGRRMREPELEVDCVAIGTRRRRCTPQCHRSPSPRQQGPAGHAQGQRVPNRVPNQAI